MRQLGDLPITVSGHVEPGFEAVRDSFLANFEQGQEAGATVAVYHRGKPVVDLAAGLRDLTSGEPYSRETLQPVFSATKGITALGMSVCALEALGLARSSYFPGWRCSCCGLG